MSLPIINTSQKQKSSQQQIDFDKQFINNNKAQSQKENEKFRIINQIDINDKHILLGTVDGMYLMNTRKNEQQRDNKKRLVIDDIWDCAFLPKSYYIAYCVNKIHERQNLYIHNWKDNKQAAKMKIQFQIDQIKPSRSCISLASSDEIFVIHFPSLKPIFNGPAGNGVRIIYDVSYQGLTIAHNSGERGQLVVRNFTNIKRNNAITQRKKSIFSSRVMMDKSKVSQVNDGASVYQSSSMVDQQEVQPIIKINAHIDMLSQIKLSPNGSKVVTASIKGTVLRIFSTKNGSKLQEFRVGYQLLKIVDINFVQDGNIVGCMNEKGAIMLYNVSMDKEEKQYETQRIGHKIYTQNNPKSFFSFLSIFYPPLNDSFPFNYYQLINPEYKQDPFEIPLDMNNIMNGSFSKSQSVYEDQRSQNRSKKLHNHSIQELDQEHLEDFIERKQEGSLISEDTSKKDMQQNIQPQYAANYEPKVQRTSLKVPTTNRNSSPQKTKSLMVDPRSFSSGNISQLKPQPTMEKKFSSISARTQKSKKQEVFQRPFYNLVSKLYITEANYIWAIKGYHIFGLKYDAFHGGEMILDFTTKIQ